MAIATQPQLTLDDFLKLPETEPASDKLPILEGIELEPTVEQVFGWLSLS